MTAFTAEKLLSEVLGFVGLWIGARWRILPQLHLDESENDDTAATTSTIRGVSRVTILRVATATTLVFFHVLLVGSDVGSRWTVPLLTVVTFLLARKTNDFDLTNPQSYALMSPANWEKPKLEMREPLIVPVVGVLISLLLGWNYSKSPGSFLQATLLLIFGVLFFTILSYSATPLDGGSEKSSMEQGHKLVKSIVAYACAVSGVLFLLTVPGMQNGLNILLIFEVALRAVQALGLIMFGAENALAGSSMMTAASIAGTILSDPLTFPGIASILAFSGSIVQLILTNPKSNDKRVALFALLFLPGVLLPGLQNASIAPSEVLESVSQVAFAQLHPVQQLHMQWKKSFESKMSRQSKTIEEATTEYQRRYQRNPPPGFDRWFQFAQDNSYVMVDEFDTLMKSLEPFWDVSPQDLVTRLNSLDDNGNNFAMIEVKNGKIAFKSVDHWYTEPVVKWFDKFEHLKILPDFNFVMNLFDEPRSIFSPEHLDTNAGVSIENPRPGELLTVDKDNVTFIDVSKQPLWPEIQPSCPFGLSPAYNDESRYTSRLNGISFLNGPPSSQDVCLSPSLRSDHGFFLAPETMQITHNVVPIFSQASPQQYSDILYPTPYYYNAVDGDQHENLDDISWSSKINQTYWAGASTGGRHTLENWKHIQRARVAMMTAPESSHPVTLLQKTTLKKWTSHTSWFATIASLFNIKVTRLVQCEDSACKKMENAFEPLKTQEENTSLKYKYVFDIDGNSYTGRFYRLLRSNGCVIKSTIFREWHDDILTPWVHYVPLSNAAEEFGEMMRFFINEPEGDKIGNTIATEGKRWANKSLRREDMEVYALRVFLEYARLFNEEERNKNIGFA